MPKENNKHIWNWEDPIRYEVTSTVEEGLAAGSKVLDYHQYSYDFVAKKDR